MPAQINTGRFSNLFARAFGAKNKGGPEVVLEDVMPVMDIFDNDGPDCAYTRGEKLFTASGIASAGGAGTYTTVAIGPQAGALVLIDQLAIACPTGNTTVYISTAYNSGTLSTSNVQQCQLESRWFLPEGSAATEPLAVLGQLATTPGASVNGPQWVAQTAYLFHVTPWTGVLAGWTSGLKPCLQLSVASANVALIWSIAGRVRQLDPSEK